MPSNYVYLPIVLTYIGVGMALSSIAIDILGKRNSKQYMYGESIVSRRSWGKFLERVGGGVEI